MMYRWPATVAVPVGTAGGLVTYPDEMSCGATTLTVPAGIANPMPGAEPPICGSAAVSVGIPTTSPSRFTRAPPLLPGLIAAEVWMTPDKLAPGEPSPVG